METITRLERTGLRTHLSMQLRTATLGKCHVSHRECETLTASPQGAHSDRRPCANYYTKESKDMEYQALINGSSIGSITHRNQLVVSVCCVTLCPYSVLSIQGTSCVRETCHSRRWICGKYFVHVGNCAWMWSLSLCTAFLNNKRNHFVLSVWLLLCSTLAKQLNDHFPYKTLVECFTVFGVLFRAPNYFTHNFLHN